MFCASVVLTIVTSESAADTFALSVGVTVTAALGSRKWERFLRVFRNAGGKRNRLDISGSKNALHDVQSTGSHLSLDIPVGDPVLVTELQSETVEFFVVNISDAGFQQALRTKVGSRTKIMLLHEGHAVSFWDVDVIINRGNKTAKIHLESLCIDLYLEEFIHLRLRVLLPLLWLWFPGIE